MAGKAREPGGDAPQPGHRSQTEVPNSRSLVEAMAGTVCHLCPIPLGLVSEQKNLFFHNVLAKNSCFLCLVASKQASMLHARDCST